MNIFSKFLKFNSLNKHGKIRVFFVIFSVFIFLVVAAIGSVIGIIITVSQNLPNVDGMAVYRPSEVTKIFSRDGQLLTALYIENRTYIPISQMPNNVKLAVMAIEDSEFLEHRGVNFKGIMRAALADFQHKQLRQGGSTITQQLARNLFLSREKTYKRKLQEILLAINIERKYSKEEILELYLNQIYFGTGSYGIEAAAKTYFLKHSKELTLAQSALLAGLPKSPINYSPYTNYKLAKKRQALVLDRMAELSYITYDEAEKAKIEPLHLAPQAPVGKIKYKAPYFTSYVIDKLIDEFGPSQVFRGGLRVYTTIDLKMQEQAETTLINGVRIGRSMRISQGAIVAVEPSTGYIRAMVGGVDYEKSKFNRAWQAKRQPGSAFKPFVYIVALDNGFSPNQVVVDGPTKYNLGGGHYWSPKNYSHKHYGAMTLTTALKNSVNVIAVKLAYEVGISTIIEYVRRLGITSVDPVKDQNLALALGGLTYGVSPLEMAGAFAAFANGGMWAEPTAITKVTYANGVIIKENPPKLIQALNPDTVAMLNAMLKQVILGGTGKRANIGRPAAGKTGTTSNFKDAWFVGYTPDLSCAVWLGNDNNLPTAHVAGGNLPAQIWATFMRQALKDVPPSDFEKTKIHIAGRKIKEEKYKEDKEEKENKEVATTNTIEVEVCAQSGKLATPYCPTIISKKYPAGGGPKGTCTLHRGDSNITQNTNTEVNNNNNSENNTSTKNENPVNNNNSSGEMVEVDICTQSGKLANPYCPSVTTKRMSKGSVPGVCTIHKAE